VRASQAAQHDPRCGQSRAWLILLAIAVIALVVTNFITFLGGKPLYGVLRQLLTPCLTPDLGRSFCRTGAQTSDEVGELRRTCSIRD
jgi:hypothetical protein